MTALPLAHLADRPAPADCPTLTPRPDFDSPTSWEVPAEDVRPGMRWRSLGRGYIGRNVESVTHRCNCTGGSRTIDSVTREPLHYPVVVIVGAGLTDTRLPGTPVTVTTGY